MLPLLLLLLLAPHGGHGCQEPELDRELVLAKVRALFLSALGPPAVTREGRDPGIRHLPRRHAVGGLVHRPPEPSEEDVSQVILFPAAGTSCAHGPAAGDLARGAEEDLLTYVFRPSQHTRSRQVTSAQLWFHTGLAGPDPAASNSSGPQLDLLVLSSGAPVAVPVWRGQAPPHWAVLHLAASALPLLTRPVLVLLLRCPLCSCPARPEATPFLVAHTRPRPPGGGERGRRATRPLSWPWSPSLLRLLQRSPEDFAQASCHRAAINISFHELGWDQWVVHPSSFIFYYCHGSCVLPAPPDPPGPGAPLTLAQPPSLVPRAAPCCAALPGARRPLFIRTSSDGGYSFKYEMVPNILAQQCACL